MLKKISLIVLFLVLSLSLQVAADSARVGMSVTIIEPTQKLETRRAVNFESEFANKNIDADQKVMKIEAAGETVISSNLPWEIYAETPELNGVDVYVRNNLNKNWVKVSQSRPVLTNRTLDRANLTWDVKVVAAVDKEVKPFAVDFKIDWPKN
ncbi:hypothetical protein [Halanaerobium kushneri]|jgi:hypothetical protein|uniref:Uncharacterized protein n=1 Tax=Halanaerobium kushneri TaxID=56779 RepID=A0A1N6SPL5_9FIRM|nr:hypothetical protein [Halanaerobium kushneri]SIQ43040.1 hypothetical protein SAMN05421834_104105 [Halanaerobium kushneri]